MAYKKTLRDKIAGLKWGQFYTAKELKDILCKEQSTIAERMLQDAQTAGYLQQGNGYIWRKNI